MSTHRIAFRRPTFIVTVMIFVVLLIPGYRALYLTDRHPDSDTAKTHDDTASPAAASMSGGEPILFPKDSWGAASIEIQPVTTGVLPQTVELTGKVALNEDRVAHVFPMVEGRIAEVKVQFGKKVNQGELLVVVQSKEVGQSMLQLFQDRLQRDFAIVKDKWTQGVSQSALDMIRLIRDGAEIEQIEKQLRDRSIGEYREKLMTAFITNYKAQHQFTRLSTLSRQGAATDRQVFDAEADVKSSRAALQALLEQVQQDAQQAALVSTQTVKDLQTRVFVGETALRILGFSDDDLAVIDPKTHGESVSHYPIRAPFDGTVISKDVVLLERVGPESQILSIADLTSVWITTDIFEEHLPLLRELEHPVIRFHTPSWPGKTFEATIFYTGDVVQESSRTVAMRALADNQDGYLKPGLFVNVDFPLPVGDPVTKVPVSAVLEHGGKTFVFVHRGADEFERRDIVTGRRNATAIEICDGVKPGEMVVTRGGFALKTRMLADLLAE